MPVPIVPSLRTAKKLGIIVPSSNTAVETLTIAILASLPQPASVIPIFTRLRVTTLSTSTQTASQFEIEKLIACAQLLADAGADLIIWNGTSGMFCGKSLEEDKLMAKKMTDAVGVTCSTNTIATVEALEFLGVRDVSIAVPYTDDVTEKLVQFFEKEEYCVHGAVAQKPTPVVRQSVKPETKAVLIACTNYPGTPLSADLEAGLDGVVVLDSIAVSAWYALKMLGIKGQGEQLKYWGSLLASL